VRLTRIDNADLNLFEYDYDLTMMIFFLDAEEKVYARYGGRDAESPDSRQSLAGLHYTMESVLRMHEREEKAFAPKSQEGPKFIRDIGGARRGCMHCHQVKEALNADLHRTGKWTRDAAWRYPLPENLGFELEVDRGNVVKAVKDRSPASAAGLKAGDVVQRLNGVPVHSFGDAQYALDRAPKTGAVEIAWQRDDTTLKDKLELPDGWRQSDISWRPSMQRLVPSVRLAGKDLTPDERKALGLSANQLAFRQRDTVSEQAKAAGVRAGDVILGVDDKTLEGDSIDFSVWVQRHYLVGDRVMVNLLRGGKRMDLPMTLLR
jgi:predicted metalloprotease with PDZ domain